MDSKETVACEQAEVTGGLAASIRQGGDHHRGASLDSHHQHDRFSGAGSELFGREEVCLHAFIYPAARSVRRSSTSFFPRTERLAPAQSVPSITLQRSVTLALTILPVAMRNMPCGTYHDQRDDDVQRDQSSAFVGKHNGQLLSVHDVCPWSLGRKSGGKDEHIFTAAREGALGPTPAAVGAESIHLSVPRPRRQPPVC